MVAWSREVDGMGRQTCLDSGYILKVEPQDLFLGNTARGREGSKMAPWFGAGTTGSVK